MSSKQLILKITQDKIWYNEKEFVSIENTNIPYPHIKFKTNIEIYWLVEMFNYSKASGRLDIVVLDYNCSQNSGFKDRTPISEVKSLLFDKFDWKRLEPLLYYHHKIMFKDQLLEPGEDPFNRQKAQAAKDVQHFEGMDFEDYDVAEQTQVSDTYQTLTNQDFTEEYEVDLAKCIFSLGHVECEVYSQYFSERFGLLVYNDILLPEFENVKSWFGRKLEKQKLKVVAEFKYIDSERIEYIATSEDIDRIDSEFIEGVKILRTQYLTKTTNSDDKSKVLFTSEDIYSLISETEGNTFQQDEKDIIQILMMTEGVRNRAELEYLSNSKQSLNHRIRFTTRPHFGFLFIVEGKISNHFVWELLESHATYMWTLAVTDSSVDLQWEKVNSEISEIVEIGRDAYKRAYKDSRLSKDFSFNVIYHREQGSSSGDSYSRWLADIKEILK